MLATNTGIVPKLMRGDVNPFPHTSSLSDGCLLIGKTVIVSPVVNIQGVLGVKVTTSGFNSRADSESKTSYTHGSNSQQFRSFEFLKYNK